MTVLKWVLVVFGVLFLALAAVIFGGFYWASTVESVKVTASDLDVGGAYPADERAALLEACTAKRKSAADGDKGCQCIAERAGTEFSRFERLVLTASFEGSATKIVALTKGFANSGIPESRIDALEQESNQRIENLLSACGFKK